jgi:protein involved in polysaccharide export with SLBB domain
MMANPTRTVKLVMLALAGSLAFVLALTLAGEAQEEYRIEPSDILTIRGPNLGLVVTVQPDGTIYLPTRPPDGTIIHPIITGPSAIPAVGLTALELRNVIAQKLSQPSSMISVRIVPKWMAPR